MNNKYIISLLLLLFAALSLQGQPAGRRPAWNDLDVYSVNKVMPHVNIIPYADQESLTRLDYRHSPYYLNLNGTWTFYYALTPAAAPDGKLLSRNAGMALPAVRKGEVKPYPITVPGNWELQGIRRGLNWGAPVYVNTTNEFPSHPPFAPVDFNPVGCYVRDFEVPAHWLGMEQDTASQYVKLHPGRHIFLKIGAVKSACYLYVNGHEVGYSEDSKTPAEFELTRYLHPGKNRMCIKVFRFCDGSYLECQDMWRMSGITRDVALYSTPETYIRDFRVRATTDTATYSSGLLDLIIDFSEEIRRPMRLEVGLFDADGRCVARKRKKVERRDWFLFFSPADFPLDTIQPWSDENPYLYTLSIQLTDLSDSVIHRVGGKVGFRTVEIKPDTASLANLLCINGRPVTIRGVNRHEHSGYTGQYVSREEMRCDIALIKSAHINAVRTSHYPDDEFWYELCDSAGIYLWDEANVESHAQGYGEQSLVKKEEWTEPILYRCNNMLQRDKNYTSVIAWSLGNECGNGICMQKAYQFMKARDASRPVTYERAELDVNTDVVEIMYPSVDYIADYARKGQTTLGHRFASSRLRPYIMAEYCHAMGNSMGGLSDYWDTIRKYPVLQGGFIWDWVDQSIILNDSLGRRCYAAGGDLGTLPGIGNDDAFCVNGLVTSDRQPHAHYFEAQAVYGNNLEQIVVSDSTFAACDNISIHHQGVETTTSGSRVTFRSDRFSLTVNTENGYIEQYQFEGTPLFCTPLRWNFWRPPTLNDLVDRNGARAWDGLDRLSCRLLSSNVSRKPVKGRAADAEVQMLFELQGSDQQKMRLKEVVEVDAEGRVQVSTFLSPMGSFRTLPKIGLQMGLDTHFVSTTWQGNSFETYPDRRMARQEGRHSWRTDSVVGEMHTVPQESGNREASWVQFSNGSVSLIVTSGDTLFGFSVRHYEDSLLTQARRIWELPLVGSTSECDHYVVSLDHRQAGLGTATCGPGVRSGTPQHPYLISGDSVYRYRFIFAPAPAATPASSKLLRQVFTPHPDIELEIPRATAAVQRIRSLTSSDEPSAQYGANFPQELFNGRRAVAGDYSEGWNGFLGLDSLMLEVELTEPTTIQGITLGFCHSPADWVLMPFSVRVQWSRDGKKFSSWQPLELPDVPTEVATRRVSFQKLFAPRQARRVKALRIRIDSNPILPAGHPFQGEKAWLMVDEVHVW